MDDLFSVGFSQDDTDYAANQFENRLSESLNKMTLNLIIVICFALIASYLLFIKYK